MAGPIVLDQQFSDVEQTRSGSRVGSDAQTGFVDDEVVVISEEEEEVQAFRRRSGRIAADQSTPVKVRAPSVHRKEVRVKPGAVYLTSGEKFGVADDQPSTSQGAGAGLAVMDEEALDYDDKFVEPVTSQKSLVLSGEVAGEVQGGRPKARGQEVVSGVRTRCAQFGLWDILSFDGRKSKLHCNILGDNWD
ncbi:hypothetical protein NDU88_006930 [Pleurodeles waltl]|uniref:Uncharacterized protein n=1 Tax=Pleurodeles waltl TaxID=8319 RepID=A0AAV7TYL4_PLEWA|nr:hypothetical protein NDU88_006930 [Pleurodeles waltl]